MHLQQSNLAHAVLFGPFGRVVFYRSFPCISMAIILVWMLFSHEQFVVIYKYDVRGMIKQSILVTVSIVDVVVVDLPLLRVSDVLVVCYILLGLG